MSSRKVGELAIGARAGLIRLTAAAGVVLVYYAKGDSRTMPIVARVLQCQWQLVRATARRSRQ
ncbi:MAG: hypothetical protein V3S12_05800 [Acidiferrobacterales bacterium]